MAKMITKYSENIFEHIKHLTDEGIEFWSARELQPVLQYTEWRNFQSGISKAIEACKGSGYVYCPRQKKI